MTLNGCLIQALVDTGAAVSLLPETQFEANGGIATEFITASGSPLKASGTLQCSVKMDDWEGQHEFYVGSVNGPVVGMDFLALNGVIIEAATGKIRMKACPSSASRSPQRTIGTQIETAIPLLDEDNIGEVMIISAEDFLEGAECLDSKPTPSVPPKVQKVPQGL
ncbi:hypothetical protein TCAL_16892 [Tigriopus californicus]|uniref:Peptidase A2 domain-containing protein n=1 Tax=Tigriopus californicus TaxID=6832 RepID=A0A553P7Y3_TIGCA|nr:hypothetical protein TCAL_16892 [Tigriopus californicus]